MKKKYLLTMIPFIGLYSTRIPNLAAMLNVSTYAARRIIDAIYMGMSIWTVIGLLVAGGAAAGIAWSLAKSAVKRFGKAAAIAW